MGIFIVCGVFATEAKVVLADDIVPDSTLPNPSKTNIQNNITTISGGTQAGNNLLHSFQEFSVLSGNTAFFDNSPNIVNIINRVTGNSISNIDGLLKANGSANLFLINPNGIIFGENAGLDIGGSFLATSADSMKFSDGSTFSAINPQELPLLTINVPIGLQYGNGGDINLGKSNLEVSSGKTLAFVGGNINLEGGQLIAESGRIELGGLTGTGEVTFNTSDNNLSLNYPVGIQRGNLLIAGAKVLSDGGGSIWVNARDVDISEVGVLRVGFAEGLGGVGAIAGDINVSATGDITLSGGSVIASYIFPNGIGEAGNINLEAGSLNLRDGSQLFSSTAGEGNSGNINVDVREQIVFDSGSNIVSSVAEQAKGKAGDVTLTTGSFSITNGSQLNAFTNGKGNTGNIIINARDAVILDGSSSIVNSVDKNGIGEAGDINLNAGSLNLRDGSQLFSSTAGEGNSGNINVSAQNNIVFDSGSNIVTSVAEQAKGKAGDITLNTGSFSITNGSQLNVSTNGKGNTGNITINARDTVILDGSSIILNSVDKNGIGEAGDINLNAGSLNLFDGSQLFSSTAGEGNSGNINVDVREQIVFDSAGSAGSTTGIISSVDTTGAGKAGDVTLTTGSFSMTNGSQLNASTNGKGNTGNITINARDTVSLDGFSSIVNSVDKNGIGEAGDINLNAGSLNLFDGSQLFSSTAGEGNSGNINVDVREQIVFDSGSNIVTSVAEQAKGKAGDVTLNTGSLLLTNGSQINANVQSENQVSAGNIYINARDTISLDGTAKNGQVSGIFATVNENAVGSGGDIDIETGSLSVTGGAGLFALTKGRGDAGDVSINARDRVSFDGTNQNAGSSGIFASVENNAVGNAGNTIIEAESLFVTGGAGLFALTKGRGNAGNVSINARDRVSFNGTNQNGGSSGIFASVENNAVGNAGNINIETDSLFVTGSAGLFALTEGEGSAGNININAGKQSFLEGFDSGIYSTVEKQAVGDGKEINIITEKLSVENGARLSSTSEGNGAAGNIAINANSIRLNRGYLNSNTVGKEGNINLRSTDLILRNESKIRTNATGQNIIGGNIDINTGVLAGFENSDITANSIDSRGGNVRINTEGVVGIKFRDLLSPLSDITAAGKNSELSGNVEVNTQLDPSRGLVELPVNLVDASNQISKVCTPRNRELNTFVSTGRGGLPMSPTEPLQDTNTLSAWVKLKPQPRNSASTISKPSTTVAHNNKVKKRNRIIEATGWIVDKHGNIEFVAQANQNNFKSLSQTAACSVSN
ncbi:filamentous hemagglutinin family N-terminal domain protein [Rivularia sp. PCC 7116]|nr:filamentous hemagglutinin family N-terminal domain protein [Rivularia sp. PCC 7116]